jgi:hypothetical protein
MGAMTEGPQAAIGPNRRHPLCPLNVDTSRPVITQRPEQRSALINKAEVLAMASVEMAGAPLDQDERFPALG